MTKKVIAGSLALLAVTAMHAQTYQLPNVGFKNWEDAGKSWLTGHADTPTEQRPYTEPTGTVNRVVQGVIIHPFHKE